MRWFLMPGEVWAFRLRYILRYFFAPPKKYHKKGGAKTITARFRQNALIKLPQEL